MTFQWQPYNWPGLLNNAPGFGTTSGWPLSPIQLNVTYPEQMPASPFEMPSFDVPEWEVPTFPAWVIPELQQLSDMQKRLVMQLMLLQQLLNEYSPDGFPLDAQDKYLDFRTGQSFRTDASHKVMVSSNDTTPGFLDAKLAESWGITLTETDDGGNETAAISVNFAGSLAVDLEDSTLELVADDLTPGYWKYYGTDGTATKGFHDLVVTDELVKVSSNDTTPRYLLAKLAAGTGITITELNDGGDEDAEISSTDELVKASSDDPTADYLDGKIQYSLEISGEMVQFVNDANAPGNWYVYGTNDTGVKGWRLEGAGGTQVTMVTAVNYAPATGILAIKTRTAWVYNPSAESAWSTVFTAVECPP